MKISALPKITKVRRDIEIPLAVMGENRSISMGQIIDAVPKDIVAFGAIRNNHTNVQFVDGSPVTDIGQIVFDSINNAFYRAVSLSITNAGQTIQSWTYYNNWDTRGDYYDSDGDIRTGCLFRANDGRLYFFNGNTLKSAGISEEQAKQIRHSTPIEVASEEEMANRIALGEYEDGQLYFLAESE